jgi:hypothetical protein
METGEPLRAAPAAPVGRPGIRGGLRDFAKLLDPVHIKHERPVLAGSQPLAVSVPPNDGGDFFRVGRIDAGSDSGSGSPFAQSREVFDFHAGIVSSGRRERNPGRENPKFLTLPSVQTKRTRGISDKKILGLTESRTMLSLWRADE